MKRDEPLISVIVPVYNGQDYLENCIRSIEEQTYENLEVIIVNDGSTDATGVVCDRLERSYDNVQVLALGDVGVSAARNTGINAAKGDYITFVDSDDRICPDMLRVLYDCILDTKSDVSGCRFFTWNSEEEWKKNVVLNNKNAKNTIYDAHRYLKEAILYGNSRCWSKLYRREIFDKVRFADKLTIGEDMLFLVKMLPHISKIAETDYQGYGYFSNPAGTINREFTPKYMDQITCWELARAEILNMDKDLDAQVTALYMMGIMLTAGKLAMLSVSGRREYEEYVQVCHGKLKEAMRVSGAFGRLSAGYRLKTRLFSLCPGLYLQLYHLQKTLR